MNGKSVCKECIEDKSKYKDWVLPCLLFEDLWSSGEYKTAKEILCRSGPYNWCPRFCNLPDRIIDIKVQRELSDIVDKVEAIWLCRRQ